MDRLGVEDDQPIEHPLVTKAIENAQRRVEAHNFEIRKHLLEYDDVMNQQREVVYSQRKEILKGDRLKEMVFDMIEDVADGIVEEYTDEKRYPEEWDLQGLKEAFYHSFSFRIELEEETLEEMNQEQLRNFLIEKAQSFYDEKERAFGEEVMRDLERFILLQTLDSHWKDHLLNIDHLKEGIGLRGYGQKNPLLEYKREGYEMFIDMLASAREDAVRKLFAVQLAKEEEVPTLRDALGPKLFLIRGGLEAPTPPPPQQMGAEEARPMPFRREGRKIGRNDPCPCGSGKKYKKCCGR